MNRRAKLLWILGAIAVYAAVYLYYRPAPAVARATEPADTNDVARQIQTLLANNDAKGRYALAAGTVFIDGDTPVQQNEIFKLDTATGQAWRYSASVFTYTNGMIIRAEGWMEVPTNFVEDLQLKASLKPGTAR